MYTFTARVEVQNGDKVGNTLVKWVFDYELRDWGIKRIGFFCPDQVVTVEYDDDSSEEISLNNVKVDNTKNRGCPRVLNLWRGEHILEF